MFCPHCGAEDQHPEAYCKRCGEWLADTSSKQSRIDVIGGRTPEKKLRGLTNNGVASAALALFAAIVVLTSLDKIGGSLILFVPLACIFVVVLQAVNVMVTRKLQNDLRRSRSDPDKFITMETKQDRPALNEPNPEQFVDVQSVTENTTRTLEPVAKELRKSE
jgi:hypothetical protein